MGSPFPFCTEKIDTPIRHIKHRDGYSWTFLSEPNNAGSQRILGMLTLDPQKGFKKSFDYWNSDDTEQKSMRELGLKGEKA